MLKDGGGLPSVKYSFTPHLSLQATGEPESVYVHENQFGDCGAQSMYFCALARSLGIPSRACGGFQLFSGNPCNHFWAEFYLPAPYNAWVPLDPTAASLAYEVEGMSAEDKQAFINYFFSQLDPNRMSVQNDVDEALTPTPGEETYFKAAFQEPAIIFEGSDKMTIIGKSYTFLKYGDLAFNYDRAIRAGPGGAVEIAADDFGVERFTAGCRFFLSDVFLGKAYELKMSGATISSDGKSATVTIPSTAKTLAYKLVCATGGKNKLTSTRRIIVSKEK